MGGGLEHVEQQLEGLAHPSRVLAPARLQTLQLVGEFGPGRVRVQGGHHVLGLAQGGAQLVHILDDGIEHELLLSVAVHLQELQQLAQVLAVLAEETAGQAAVHELDAAADGARFAHLGEFPREGLQVDFKGPVAVLGPLADQPLLESQVVGHRYLGHLEGGGGETQIRPASHTAAQSHVKRRTVQGGFLGPVEYFFQGRAGQAAAVGRLAHRREGLDQVAAQQKRALLLLQLVLDHLHGTGLVLQEFGQLCEEFPVQTHECSQSRLKFR
jgi:hypothetical protein